MAMANMMNRLGSPAFMARLASNIEAIPKGLLSRQTLLVCQAMHLVDSRSESSLHNQKLQACQRVERWHRQVAVIEGPVMAPDAFQLVVGNDPGTEYHTW